MSGKTPVPSDHGVSEEPESESSAGDAMLADASAEPDAGDAETPVSEVGAPPTVESVSTPSASEESEEPEPSADDVVSALGPVPPPPADTEGPAGDAMAALGPVPPPPAKTAALGSGPDPALAPVPPPPADTEGPAGDATAALGPVPLPPAPSAASGATGAFSAVPMAGMPVPSAASGATGTFPMGLPAPAPHPAPMSPAVKKQLKVGFGALGLVLVLAIAGVVAVSILNSYRGPEKQVETYLRLIADGHAQEAGKMVDPGVPDGKRLLLTDEALGAATDRITAINVEKPDVDGDDDTARVTATFRLDGQKLEHTFSLSRGDKEYGLLDSWEMTDDADNALVNKVELSSSFDSLIIGGQEVPLSKGGGRVHGPYETEQYVYFGVYSISASESRAKYLTPDTTSLEAYPEGSGSSGGSPGSSTQTLSVGAEPTQELKDLVLDKVKQKTTDCTTPPSNMSSECPYALQSRYIAKMEVTTEAADVTIDSTMDFTSDRIVVTTTSSLSYSSSRPERNEFKFEGEIEWVEGQDEPNVTITGSTGVY
ncbi:hypothetical protein [Actinomyces israelii]|uniref:hypothetical protein n=1 Tax=Actinomyces israelii TaxID=1659 RepID=UPI0023569FF2|nr:hypothetical protein [Actinomyces israelii]